MAPSEEKAAAEHSPVVAELQKLDDKYFEFREAMSGELLKTRRSFLEKKEALMRKRQDLLMQAEEDEDMDANVAAHAKTLGTPGLPGFWLQVLQKSPDVDEEGAVAIYDYDEMVLDYLSNVRSEWLDETWRTGFKMVWEFAPNPYFENKELVQIFRTNTHSKYIREFGVEKLEVAEPIKWKAGKDVTFSEVKVKAKGKKKGNTKKVPRPSFFKQFRNLPGEELDDDERQFLSMELMEESDDEIDDDQMVEFLLCQYYEFADQLRGTVIPRSARVYTGDVFPSDDESGDMNMDDDDDDDDDDDES
eukprot:CAMPEP_0204326268 /NCGR_PEP_ID=MMETSP0469-20131031/11687_1 /ASSEMBLY_ACC=CAM_ASM_000384 /TAXON_ID=2969 /ORGANISM="Oxyrrhis marina" /LENGTH=303 /DNA_ID=CAMNT_0051308277 /DNA_START=32 /DNA_END=943 /DNA_ORIENTATION=+